MSSDVLSSDPGGWGIYPFIFQSHTVTGLDWSNLVTIGLAPLIAHVFGGAPTPVYLSNKLPNWHDRICLYNPTTILWRYFVIADRRLRAKTWSVTEMAASNAIFWTGGGWDGSLEMIERSRAFCLRLPRDHRVRILSGSMFTTVIVTVQGAMAIKTLVDGINGNYAVTVNISSIFYPLAVFGLLRLLPALWLTDDYLYHADMGNITTAVSSTSDVSEPKEMPHIVESRTYTTVSQLDLSNDTSLEKFHPIDSLRAILFRIFYLVPVCCLLGVCLAYLVPRANRSYYTVTTFLLLVFYTFFLAISVLVFAFYFLSGKSTSTIIPCFSTIWYKLYTCIIMMLMVALVVVAALETRKSPCGVFTTEPSSDDDQVCPEGYYFQNNTVQGLFGIVLSEVVDSNGTIDLTPTTDASKTTMGLLNFVGVCFGHVDSYVPKVVVYTNATFQV